MGDDAAPASTSSTSSSTSSTPTSSTSTSSSTTQIPCFCYLADWLDVASEGVWVVSCWAPFWDHFPDLCVSAFLCACLWVCQQIIQKGGQAGAPEEHPGAPDQQAGATEEHPGAPDQQAGAPEEHQKHPCHDMPKQPKTA